MVDIVDGVICYLFCVIFLAAGIGDFKELLERMDQGEDTTKLDENFFDNFDVDDKEYVFLWVATLQPGSYIIACIPTMHLYL